MNERNDIELLIDHRGKDSSTFTGRPQGEQVRAKLNLDQKDKDSKLYRVTVPKGTSSFNASFYLGLFFDSIIFLRGLERFKNKYEITILDENIDIKEGIREDIEDCERQALNEYLEDTGLDF